MSIQDRAEWKGLPLVKTWRTGSDGSSFEPFFQVAAVCLNKDNQILLVQHPTKNFWMLPGGTPNKNESPEETLKREVMEEASCLIDTPRLVGAVEMDFPANPNLLEGEHFFQLRYFAKVEKICKQTPDPDHNICLVREFVEPRNFFEYISYDRNIHEELLVLLKGWVKTN